MPAETKPAAAGAAPPASDSFELSELQQLVADLRALQVGLSPLSPAGAESGVGGQTIGRRLRQAWARFATSEAKRTFEQTSLAALASAVRDVRDVAYSAAYHLQLQARLQGPSFSASGGGNVSLADLVDELSTFNQVLAGQSGKQLDPADRALSQLSQLRQQVVQKHQRLEKELATQYSRARDAAQRASAVAVPAGEAAPQMDQYRLETLLSTPLLRSGTADGTGTPLVLAHVTKAVRAARERRL